MKSVLLVLFFLASLFIYSEEKIAAIGDIHGDYPALKKALKIAGAIDEKGSWIGGKMIVVQTGDYTDRGSDEPEIIELLDKLEKEAASAGGALIVLNANHELMNAEGDYRYAGEESVKKFAKKGIDRTKEFQKGGILRARLAKHNIAVIVGKNLFVHGGVKPEHAKYGIEKLNNEAKSWFLGERAQFAEFAKEMLWMRDYSTGNPDKKTCDMIEETLKLTKTERIVMGHTSHEKINAVCGGKAYRIDTGMSKSYGGKVQVLLITGDKVKVLE